jgi:hypothetical protein
MAKDHELKHEVGCTLGQGQAVSDRALGFETCIFGLAHAPQRILGAVD